MQQSKKEIQRKPGRRVFHSIVGNPGDYQADILFPKYADTPQMKAANEGYTCLLICVEVPTRYLYMVPMKTKEGPETKRSFEKVLFELHGQPFHNLTTDDGSEFTNHAFSRLLQDRGITHYVKEVGDRFSLGIIDRVCRTIKEWMEDWMIENESPSWVDSLPDVTGKYNSHVIRTLQASPDELRDDDLKMVAAILQDAARGEKAMDKFREFSVGDTVRVREMPADKPRDRAVGSKPSDKVAKGSERWSHKVYTITGVDRLSFELEDSAGKPASRTYRQHELLKVPDTSIDVPDVLELAAYQGRMKRRMAKEGIESRADYTPTEVKPAIQERPTRDRKAPQRIKSHALWN